jgi:hypothetical protein
MFCGAGLGRLSSARQVKRYLTQIATSQKLFGSLFRWRRWIVNGNLKNKRTVIEVNVFQRTATEY